MNRPITAATAKPTIENRMPLFAASTTDANVRVSASGSVGSSCASSRRADAMSAAGGSFVRTA